MVDGIVEYLEKFNIKVFGPNKLASQLEGSKIFTKTLENKKSTAKFGIFHNKRFREIFLQLYLSNQRLMVLQEKGFIFVRTKIKLRSLLMKFLMENFKAHEVLVEEFLKGEEMSFFIISDGQNFKTFGTVKITKELRREIEVKIQVVWELIHPQD